MKRRNLLGPAVAVLAASVLLSACGGGSKAPASGSGSPASATPLFPTGTPVVILGGTLSTVTPPAGALKGRTLPGTHLGVHVTGGSLLFVVNTSPQTAVFRCALAELPRKGDALPHDRKVPIHVAVTYTHGFKTYHVRPSKPLTPGLYKFDFGGVGQYELSLYKTVAH